MSEPKRSVYSLLDDLASQVEAIDTATNKRAKILRELLPLFPDGEETIVQVGHGYGSRLISLFRDGDVLEAQITPTLSAHDLKWPEETEAKPDTLEADLARAFALPTTEMINQLP